MNFSSILSRAAAVLLLAVPFATAQAVPVSFKFTAEITGVWSYDSVAGTMITEGVVLRPGETNGIGDILSGVFGYDTEAPLHPHISTEAGVQHWYQDLNPSSGAVFSNLDKSFTYSSSSPDWWGTTLSVKRDSPSYTFMYIGFPSDQSAPYSSFSLGFSDYSNQLFADLRPSANLDLGNDVYTTVLLTLDRGSEGSVTLWGTIRGLSAVGVPGLSGVDGNDEDGSAVPEPAQLLLFALAGLAAGVVGWRRMPR